MGMIPLGGERLETLMAGTVTVAIDVLVVSVIDVAATVTVRSLPGGVGSAV
jgi:hypothetical protein